MWPEAERSFSLEADWMIDALVPRKASDDSTRFPASADWASTDLRADETCLHKWFVKVIGSEDKADRRIRECHIEDNMAIFASMEWRKEFLWKCQIQALIVEGKNLRDYYLEGNTGKGDREFYYRLDLDLGKTGRLFDHPVPHIHASPSGGSRFPFREAPNEFLPVAFLEFIYLNHYYNKWLEWAKRACKARPDFSTIPIARLDQGFKTGNIVSDPGLRKYLAPLRQALNEKCLFTEVRLRGL